MSAINETYHNSVQVIKDFIGIDLINDAITEVQSGSRTPAADRITTKLDWTPACERLREYFVQHVHPEVSS